MTTASDQGQPRRTSKNVATKPGCAPLKGMYEASISARPRTWNEISEPFLRAMEEFDDNIVSGVADMGDLQNGKGDFFNDLLALILENCAEVTLYSRGGVPGLIFPKHHLDVTYPSTGTVEFLLEAKAVGTPKHPGSPKQKPMGRAGSADLDKRVKEAGFKTIDLKAEYGRIQAARGESPSMTPGGNLTTWLRAVKPRSYLFIAGRLINSRDLVRVVKFADAAAMVMDAVGVFCFKPKADDTPTRYESVDVPPHIAIDRVLYRACQDLVALREEPPEPEQATPSPAAEADAIPEPEE